jgi:hypothetical protein
LLFAERVEKGLWNISDNVSCSHVRCRLCRQNILRSASNRVHFFAARLTRSRLTVSS